VQTLPPSPVRSAGHLRLCLIDRGDLDLRRVQEQIELSTTVFSVSCLDHYRALQERCRRKEPYWILFHDDLEPPRFLFIEEQGGNGRGVNHHRWISTIG
jgi:hypothetical protein